MGEIFVRPLPATPLPFTGERLTSELTGETEIEHLHRYLNAREFCKGKDVLDVASGEGYGSALLAQVAASVIGVEVAADAITHARTSYQRDNLKFIQCDARIMDVPSESVDVVVSFETIEHFAEQGQFLQEVRRVLRPNGTFIVSTPDRDNYSPAEAPANPYHVLELTHQEFGALLAQYFPHVRYLLQRPILGSVMLPSTCNTGTTSALCFEKRGEQYFEASRGLPRPRYVIALASDSEIRDLPPTVYFETSRLDSLAPSHEIVVLQQELEAQKRAVASTIETLQSERSIVTSKLAACEQQQSVLSAKLSRSEQQRAELSVEFVRGEQQRSVLRTELNHSEQQRAELSIELARTEQQLHAELDQSRREIRALKSSTSWRVTAPLRSFKRLGSFAPVAIWSQVSSAPSQSIPGVSPINTLLRRMRTAIRYGRQNGFSALVGLTRHKMGLTAGKDLRPGAVLSRSSRNGQSTPAALQSRRAQTLPYPTTPAFVEPNLKPVSVVIPTYNRAGLLEKTLRSCIEHSGGVDIELLVIDDGSTDDTADVLARLGSEIPNLAWRSIPNGGPGKARNLGASIAKHPVILFLGDDIQPLDSNFFVVHARLHALNPSDRFAVLGKAVWPAADVADVNFVMKHIQGRGGEQFGYADLTPHTYLDWKFFYTSNVSVKRTVVGDWITDGFQAEFKLAAFEDIELAYRLCKQPGSFRIYYDPTSLGRHIHPYTLNGFLNRQMGSGMMAKVFIDLHPEAIGPLGLKPLVQVLSSTSSQTQEKSTADYLSIIEGIRAWARMLESNNGLGREWWHEDLLFAVFEATYLQGFLLMQAENSSNFAGGYNYILTRCLQRLRKTIHHELTSHEFLKARLGFALAD